MDPVSNGFSGAPGGARGRILQSKGGVLSTSVAYQVGEISLHITCCTSPAYCVRTVSSTSAPASQEVSWRNDPSPVFWLFVAVLLFSPHFLLLLHLIFFLRPQCWKRRQNAKDVDEATWYQCHSKSNNYCSICWSGQLTVSQVYWILL